MSKRPPSPPPRLPEFDYVKLLGSGGFADVFLFQQHMPRRQVAVKVLLDTDLSDASITRFRTEANAMAELSDHPAIVSIYGAGVSPEGRPYLVMEYCPRPNLQVRHRQSLFSEAETLRIGVQIAGAIETAHRAGILHRDVKPANILTTNYGLPVLTDFGIAATATSGGEVSGLSIPWAPPELFASTAEAAATTDVYALAATLYTLLAGRSPFERPGQSNSSVELISRIQSDPVSPIDRADVSEALQQVLRRAMAKAPGERYPTAIQFAHALQRVQIESGLQPTRLDVAEPEFSVDRIADDDESTRIRSITEIDLGSTGHTGPTTDDQRTLGRREQQPSSRPRPASLAMPEYPAPEDTQLRTPVAPPQAAATQDSPPARPSTLSAPQPGPVASKRQWIVWAAVAVALLGVGGFAVTQLIDGAPDPGPAPPTSASAAPVDPLNVGRPPQVEDLQVSVAGEVATFTWSNPDPLDGDQYSWRQQILGGLSDPQRIDEPTLEITLDADAPVCIEVSLVRSNGRASDPQEVCSDE